MKFHRSAGIIPFRKKKKEIEYLLLHYEAGHWDFPKGMIEKGESEIETAKRELKEEAGIEANVISGFEEKIQYFFKEGGELVKKEVIFFLGEAKNDEVKISYEHIGYEWLPYEKAVERLTFKNSKEILKKAESFLKNKF
ncbi:MAG: bis(5'-nucleosyl)-tetraphosphatase [Candidatus Aenigmatarchaeota archaeon]